MWVKVSNFLPLPSFDDEEEAIALANATTFGLAGRAECIAMLCAVYGIKTK